MPGMALRMAASITVAPFSTSMVRVAPVWSTKWILAMMLVLPVEEVGSPYNGSIRFAPALGLKSCGRLSGVAGSGPVEDGLDRRAGLGQAFIERREGRRHLGLAGHGGFQPLSGLGDAESADRPGRSL